MYGSSLELTKMHNRKETPCFVPAAAKHIPEWSFILDLEAVSV